MCYAYRRCKLVGAFKGDLPWFWIIGVIGFRPWLTISILSWTDKLALISIKLTFFEPIIVPGFLILDFLNLTWMPTSSDSLFNHYWCLDGRLRLGSFFIGVCSYKGICWWSYLGKTDLPTVHTRFSGCGMVVWSWISLRRIVGVMLLYDFNIFGKKRPY